MQTSVVIIQQAADLVAAVAEDGLPPGRPRHHQPRHQQQPSHQTDLAGDPTAFLPRLPGRPAAAG